MNIPKEDDRVVRKPHSNTLYNKLATKNNTDAGSPAMATISWIAFANAFSWQKISSILIQILLNYVPKSPTDNKSALVQVMTWRRTGDKALPEPMMAQIGDAFMHQQVGTADVQLPFWSKIPCDKQNASLYHTCFLLAK